MSNLHAKNRAKSWLADDPDFLATLSDLDRGLADGGEADAVDEEPPSALAPSPVGGASSPAQATASQPAAAPVRPTVAPQTARVVDPAQHLDAAAPAPPLAFAPAERPVRRPLLDLFPPWALEAERPPLPTLGTAGDRQRPPARSRPAPVPPTDAPSQLDAPTYETFLGRREKAFSLSADSGQQSAAGAIDGVLVDAAVADLDLDLPRGEERGLLATLLLVAAFALLVLAGAAAALWVSRDAVGRTILQWQNVPAAPGGPMRLLPVPLAPIPPPEISDSPVTDNLQPPPSV